MNRTYFQYNKKGFSIILILLVIVFVAAGAAGFLYLQEPGSSGTVQEVQLSSSDEVGEIKEDLEDTDFDQIDVEINAIEAELDAAAAE